jgi:hypothetical protein
MNWHTKLYGQSITHRDLDNLGISVENLRKANTLANSKLDRYNHYQIMRTKSKELDGDEFVLFKK